MTGAVNFRRDTASVDDIASHLRETDRSFIPPLSDRVDIEAYVEKLFRAGTRCEAWSEARLIGLVAGYLNDPETGFISSVSVAAGWERRSIGRKLVASFIESAALSGIGRLLLEVHCGNISASNLYKAVGFIEEGRNGDIVTMSLKIGAAK